MTPEQIAASVPAIGSFDLIPEAEGAGIRALGEQFARAGDPVGTLACILANPPTTSGARTLARVELARDVMGFREVRTANLFARPSHRTSGIGPIGVESDGWLEARPGLQDVLQHADAILLAYGVVVPAGRARVHCRDQTEWLDDQIASRRLPTFQVGDGPRHPSRWQRWTFRLHPELEFIDALRLALVEVGGNK